MKMDTKCICFFFRQVKLFFYHYTNAADTITVTYTPQGLSDGITVLVTLELIFLGVSLSAAVIISAASSFTPTRPRSSPLPIRGTLGDTSTYHKRQQKK